MLGLLLMTLLPVAILSVLPQGWTGTPDDDGDAGLDGDLSFAADDDIFGQSDDTLLSGDFAQVTDFTPAQDRLQLVVDGDGTGVVTTAPDPEGRGTLVSYDGTLVALVHGHDAAEIGQIDVITRNAG